MKNQSGPMNSLGQQLKNSLGAADISEMAGGDQIKERFKQDRNYSFSLAHGAQNVQVIGAK